MSSVNGSTKGAAGFFRPAASGFGIVRLFERVLDWQERSKQRVHLMELDDRMLRDIGMTRADAVREYRKHPWLP